MNKNDIIFYLIIISGFIIAYFFLYESYKIIFYKIEGFETTVFYLKFIWFIGLLNSLANLAGLVLLGYPKTDKQFVTENSRNKKKSVLIVTYVSRGENAAAVNRSIKKSTIALEEAIPFVIEVVTDLPIKIEYAQAKHYLVPKSWQSSQHAKYKARALEYLRQHRENYDSFEFKGQQLAFDSTYEKWILHLDEESYIDKEGVLGIKQFIEDPSNHNTIGQGEILYNGHNYGSNLVIEALDTIRTGDDLGRYRLQYAMFHCPLFGMHGSFILLPLEVENKVTFDLSSRGSVTEDAYFALIAYSQGYRFNWVTGNIREQSPYTLFDFLKQRRRWFCGLWLLVKDNIIPLKYRFTLGISMLNWTLSWIGFLAFILCLFMSSPALPSPLCLLVTFIFGVQISSYLIGAFRNIEGVSMPLSKKIKGYSLCLTLIPFAFFIESAAVIYALINPISGFDIINKN